MLEDGKGVILCLVMVAFLMLGYFVGYSYGFHDGFRQGYIRALDDFTNHAEESYI